MIIKTIHLVCSFLWLCLFLSAGSAVASADEMYSTNPYIERFEALEYNSADLHERHQRTRRSIHNQYTDLHFKAYGRNFHLRLKRDTTTFSNDFKIELADKSLQDHDISYIVDGDVVGEPDSYVHGSIIEGVFTGRIHTKSGTFYVQRAEQVLDTEQEFHSVIYHDDHVNENPEQIKRLKRSAEESASCGLSKQEIYKKMQQVSLSAVDSEPREKRYADDFLHENRKSRHNIYTHDRDRRQTQSSKRTCTMFLQSDTMLWDYFTVTMKYGPTRAKEEITSFFADHIKGIKSIYEDTKFESIDGAKSFTAISFVVRRIKINETATSCKDGINTPILVNPFCQPNIDVSNFLNLNSLSKHDDFCLAYVFTYRDFSGGTLGLAWVGSPSAAAGGICEQYKKYIENDRNVYKSLNTGIMTIVNYNKRVPPKVSTLTLAHEVGHNFGSPHDDGRLCTPYTKPSPDKNGNYIMFASATSGDRKNNQKFSICSKGNITEVLDAIINHPTKFRKKNCFVESQAAFCGNMILEDGEQCDCGYEGDCNDNCCYPRGHANECRLRAENNVSCSPSQGPCCTENCTFRPAGNYTCANPTDCTNISVCNGTTAVCPTPAPLEDNTPCNDNTQVCKKGDCTGSVCDSIGWEQCFLVLPADRSKQNRSKLCYVSCKKGTNGSCISTRDKKMPEEMVKLLNSVSVGKPIQLPAGAPCDNFQGYCDVFHKCRGVDADGPLARLKNLLFNVKTINTIRDWITEYWWAVLLIGVGLVIFMGLFIKVCAVHTPSSNPKKKPARKISMRSQPRGPPPPYPGPNRGGPAHGKGRSRAQQHRGQNYEMKSPRV